MAEAGFDWPGLIRLGMGALGLPPERFWALTPAELAWLAGIAPEAEAATARARLEALMARFPDRPAAGEQGGGA
ncbi:MAG: phage tail assembly chaperone [Alphaproteobacteria bacterium]|nr:MAG: phage tail assembly chaperone [Alphaproteobacteria bacterium]